MQVWMCEHNSEFSQKWRNIVHRVRQHVSIYLITRFTATLQHSASPSHSANRNFNIKLACFRSPLQCCMYVYIEYVLEYFRAYTVKSSEWHSTHYWSVKKSMYYSVDFINFNKPLGKEYFRESSAKLWSLVIYIILIIFINFFIVFEPLYFSKSRRDGFYFSLDIKPLGGRRSL